MIGTLNHEQIEHVLQRELIGRIGFLSGERIHILPVAFAYSNGYIYAHSKEGAKVKQMRKLEVMLGFEKLNIYLIVFIKSSTCKIV